MGEASQAAGSTQGGGVRQVSIDQLVPNPFQPRGMIAPEQLEELAESIRAQGLLQPILVRPDPADPQRYQIVAGERRWRAASLAGLHEVPVYLREMTDRDSAAAAIVENLQRQDLNPIEEAEGFQRLIEEFEFTHEAMGYAIGKSRSHITNFLRLLQLPQPVQKHVREGKLSYGHARALVSHPAPEAAMTRILDRGMSVRQTEAMVLRDNASEPTGRKAPPDADLEAMEQELTRFLGLKVRLKVNVRGKGHFSIAVDDWTQVDQIRTRLKGE